MKRVLSILILTVMLVGATGCAFFDILAIDLGPVAKFTAGWQNSTEAPLLEVLADTVVLNGTSQTKSYVADYFADPSWWNGQPYPNFVGGTPDITGDTATTTIDFTWQGTAVLVNIGLTKASGKWKINSVAVHDDWRP